MAWREFFVTNRWQKLAALVLAVLIWLTVRPGSQLAPIIRDLGQEARTFESLPVRVLTRASDLGRYRIEPRTVTVVLRGNPSVIGLVEPVHLNVYVSLTDDGMLIGTRQINVVAPTGTEVVSVLPREALVERQEEE